VACSTCSGACSCGGHSAQPGCTPGGPTPVTPATYPNTQPTSTLACTLLGGLQGVVDGARRIVHEVGARAYRVRLVWQERDGVTGLLREVYSLELVPVRVDVGREQFSDEVAGQVPGGAITLREVSPIQVDELTLRGYLQGENWSQDNPAREFFFELEQIKRCAGDPAVERYRYVLDGVPELLPDRFEWRVRLLAQFGRRTRAGQDSTVPGAFYPLPDAAVIS
jgi:hypothetical protein